ncbi:unnamed protein product [Schistosoma turkestanicum]|nr:unnamed protein product [Schistosoma turkestanicum]
MNNNQESVVFGLRFSVHFIKYVFRQLEREFLSPLIFMILLIFITGFYEYAAYQIGLISSNFFDALTNRNYDRFIWTLKLSVMYILCGSLALGVQNMITGQLSLILREILTKNLQSLYFKRKNYYVINTLINLDNPDQRLTQDINVSCDLLTNVIVSITINPMLVVFYTYMCVQKAGWLGPSSAYILFIIFSVISRFLTSWSSHASFDRQKQEGNFRFVHTKLRCSVESAGFLDLSESLNAISLSSFNRLFHAIRVFINRNAVVFYVTQLNAYCGGVVNYIALGLVLFNGPIRTMSASEITVLISQTSFFLLYLINKLTNLVNLSTDIAQLVGVGHRIVNLDKYLGEVDSYHTPAAYIASYNTQWLFVEPKIISPMHDVIYSDVKNCLLDDIVFRIDHISICVPSNPNNVLIRDLCLTIKKHEALLITGPSGVGKTALFRVLAGLWPGLVLMNNSMNNNNEVNASYHFYQSANLQIVFIPQELYIPWITIQLNNEFYKLFTNLHYFMIELNSPILVNIHRELHLCYLLLNIAYSFDNKFTTGINAGTVTLNEIQTNLTNHNSMRKRNSRYLIHDYNLDSFEKALTLLVEFRLIRFEKCNVLKQIFKLYYDNENNNGKYFNHQCQIPLLTDICYSGFSVGSEKFENKFDLQLFNYSPGELQRLTIAAVCFYQPDIIFMDESTSQLSVTDESQVYGSLSKRNITPITIGHHNSVRQYHLMELQLMSIDEQTIITTTTTTSATTELDQSKSWKLIEIA